VKIVLRHSKIEMIPPDRSYVEADQYAYLSSGAIQTKRHSFDLIPATCNPPAPAGGGMRRNPREVALLRGPPAPAGGGSTCRKGQRLIVKSGTFSPPRDFHRFKVS